MAGKRQHFIPRFLQVGFASQKIGDEIFTWVYRKGQAPFECNIVNVGIEREFYSIGTDTAADDAITAIERPFSTLVNSLRSAPPQRVTQPLVPDLISHFEIRTRHLRQTFIAATDYLVGALAAFLSNAPVATEYFTRIINTDPEILRKPLAEKLGIPQAFADWLVANAPPEIFRETVSEWLPVIAVLIQDRLRAELQAIGKQSHIRALKSTVSPTARADRLRTLQYATVEYKPGDLILGDSIVLFEVDGSRRYKTLLDSRDDLKGVYLPLSPRTVLVGRSSLSNSVPADLPEAIASSSFEYFISHRNAEENEQLRSRIGEAAAIMSNEELDNIVRDAFAE